MNSPRLAALVPILLAAATACGSGATGSAVPQSIGQPGLSGSPSPAAKDCAEVTRDGAPVTVGQVVGGCTSNGKNVVLLTRRCKDGRTYLIYGTSAKGIIGGVWRAVGPGHEAAAKRFAAC